MEPLSTAAVAIASIIVTKTFEKTGEKLGETFVSQVSQLIKMLRSKPSVELAAINQGDGQISYGRAVTELESAVQEDIVLGQTVAKLAETVISEPFLLEKVKATAEAVQQEPSIINDYRKLADKIGVVVQPGASATFGDIVL